MNTKPYSLTLLFILSALASHAQNWNYYYYDGEKINLEIDRRYVNLIVGPDFIAEEISDLGIELLELKKKSSPKEDHQWAKLKFLKTPSETKFLEKIDALKRIPAVKVVSFYYNSTAARSIGTSDIFYVKLKKEEDVSLLEKLSSEKKVTILRQNKFMPLWYTLSGLNSGKNGVELSNYYYETGFFTEVDPAFMFNFKPSSDDEFFEDLWGLLNTSNIGIDIDIENAWKITEGHDDILVGVVDDGLDFSHNDLSGNISGTGYNTITGTSPSDLHGDHGTHVGGTIAAIKDNNLQVVGVAPKSSLLSISSDLIPSFYISEELANGMNWAWINGADVINNSWGDQGGFYYSEFQSAILEDAITNAIDYGRNGNGSIVAFAAGNYAPAIDYPASFSPDILTIGSIGSTGSRASSSGYGNELDVVAPGVGILSTVLNNGVGYKSGTSMATAHVSGVAALVLSINSNLTVYEVLDIIEQSAQKIRTDLYTYTTTGGRPNGTWNNQMGYGLVNAYKALIYTIENYGAHLGTEMSQVTLPLYNDLTLQENVSLESGSNLTIESKSGTVSIAAASGTVTIGGSGGAPKIAIGNNSGYDEGTVDNETGETEDPQTVPGKFMLSNNYPNPFNPTTIISYQLPVTIQVTLKVFDMLGREVATLVNGRVSAVQHEVQFDASNLSPAFTFIGCRQVNLSKQRK